MENRGPMVCGFFVLTVATVLKISWLSFLNGFSQLIEISNPGQQLKVKLFLETERIRKLKLLATLKSVIWHCNFRFTIFF